MISECPYDYDCDKHDSCLLWCLGPIPPEEDEDENNNIHEDTKE